MKFIVLGSVWASLSGPCEPQNRYQAQPQRSKEKLHHKTSPRGLVNVPRDPQDLPEKFPKGSTSNPSPPETSPSGSRHAPRPQDSPKRYRFFLKWFQNPNIIASDLPSLQVSALPGLRVASAGFAKRKQLLVLVLVLVLVLLLGSLY